MEDSKKELRPVGQELAVDRIHAFKSHHLSVATEVVLDTISLSSPSGLVVSEQATEALHGSSNSEDNIIQNPPTNVSDLPAVNVCNGNETPRNVSPMSDNSTTNLDPATRTYVSYSTPSLDDVTMVETIPKVDSKLDVTHGNRAHMDVSRDADNDATGVPQPLQCPHFVVVAIDIGTTYSGYAFCFTRGPDSNIHMMRKWEGKICGTVHIL